MLGLGRERVVRVPVDGQGRMTPPSCPPIDGPTIVCMQAGNVNTGAFDPIGEIAARLRGDRRVGSRRRRVRPVGRGCAREARTR